jgi:hypothetical protein
VKVLGRFGVCWMLGCLGRVVGVNVVDGLG